MVRYRDTLWCDGCGVEIRWKPLVKDQRYYCCRKCLNGEICDCGAELDDYPPAARKPSTAASRLPLNENG